MSGQDRLERLAGRVADGEEIDWAQAEAEALAPGERDEVLGLRTLALLASALGNAPDASATPRTWARLWLRERIGAGSFGEVYRAFDPQLRRDVALKLLAIDRGPRARAAVLSEARRLARIRHPNVVVVHGAEEHDGRAGFWMEFVAGATLAQRLAEHGPLPASEVAQIGASLCGALGAVHAAGLVHGDVKAGNVMRADDGRVLLMDFGAVSEHGQLGVTPLYAAPEVLEGAVPAAPADVYALGVLLFHLVTGAFPVEGEKLEELRAAHAAGRRRSLREVRPDLPARFVAAVERALAPSKDRRPSASMLARALAASQGVQKGRSMQTWQLALAGALLAVLAILVWPRPPAERLPRAPQPAATSSGPEIVATASALEPAAGVGQEIAASEAPRTTGVESPVPTPAASPVAPLHPATPELPPAAPSVDPALAALDAALAPLAEKVRRAEALEAFRAANCQRQRPKSRQLEATCGSDLQDLAALRREIRDALALAEDDARRARVLPGDVRNLRDKYGLGSIRWEFP